MIWCQGFFGAPGDVARQLYAVPQSVVRGQYYALLLQSGVGADVRVFVRGEPDDTRGEVRDWLGARLGDLPERILLACRAAPTDGDGVVRVIDGFADYAVRTGISCPPTARGAFGHQLRRHEGAAEIQAFVVSAPVGSCPSRGARI